jgi:hypothetical protein
LTKREKAFIIGAIGESRILIANLVRFALSAPSPGEAARTFGPGERRGAPVSEKTETKMCPEGGQPLRAPRRKKGRRNS